MSSAPPTDVNHSRRRLLIRSTTTIGSVGAIAALIPFVRYCNPSSKIALVDASVTLDVSTIAAGQMIVAQWQGKPVYIVRRTAETILQLTQQTPNLRDPASLESKQPDYAKNAYRSRDPSLLVMVAVCTHLGCAPGYRPDHSNAPAADWTGGFVCPCHGSTFDLAGRVYHDVPAPLNMEIPPYTLVGHILTLGTDV
jgi:ubiquinol-cytochrome c reductase iron-sulfur subunit